MACAAFCKSLPVGYGEDCKDFLTHLSGYSCPSICWHCLKDTLSFRVCVLILKSGLYARVPLLARAQEQRNRACKALAAARASGPEGAEKVCETLAMLVIRFLL